MVNNSALTALTEGQKKSKCVDQTIFRICAKIAVVWWASRTEIPSHTPTAAVYTVESSEMTGRNQPVLSRQQTK
jgi:hypothetical protein